MKISFQIIAIAVMFFVTYSLGAEDDQLLQAEPNLPEAKAAVIICKGMIDDGLYKSIQRRTQLALNAGATYVIYEIGTYGGLVKTADDISKYLILDINKKADTVAYVTTEAISAGSLISVACKDIIMRENTTIGDCAPISLGGPLEGVEREKTESFIRAIFMRAAEANNYPAPLLKAMVSVRIKLYRVKNLKTDKFEFFEDDHLPKDPNAYDLENKQQIVSDEELLTLTASQSLEYGLARAVVTDRAQALQFLAERDGVIFTSEPNVYKTIWSEEMVRWINSPAMLGLLVMVGMLGLYIELNTPGVGLPGLVAVMCFVIIFGSKFLVGMANWVEIAAVVTGVALLLIEIFVLPGFGIAGTLGILFIIGGFFGMLVKNPPEKFPWPQTDFDWTLFTNSALGLLCGFAGFVILAWIITKYLPKAELFSGLILKPAQSAEAAAAAVVMSVTAPPEEKVTGVKVDEVGKTITALHPAGSAQFGSAVVDVVAESAFIEKDREVKIIEIHGNRVVVRVVE